jgi:hypothetical protein
MLDEREMRNGVPLIFIVHKTLARCRYIFPEILKYRKVAFPRSLDLRCLQQVYVYVACV